MTLAPRPHSTAADLLRLLAAWLAAIVLVQGLAAARSIGLGPLHHHVVVAAHDHRHHHDGVERHHHAADAGVLTVASPESSFDEAALALVAALVLMVLAVTRALADPRRHVWRAATGWAWLPCLSAPARRPPRRT